MGYCKSCGVELKPTLKAGRPRKWCEQCHPRPRFTSSVRDDHDQEVILQEARDAEEDDAERQELEHKRKPAPAVEDEDDPSQWL